MRLKLLSNLDLGEAGSHKENSVVDVDEDSGKHLVNIGAAVETNEDLTPQGETPVDYGYPKVVDGIRYEYDKSESETPILACDDATFENLQESPAGYGKNDEEAFAAYTQSKAEAQAKAAEAAKESDSSEPPFNPNDQAGPELPPSQPAAPVVPNGLPLSDEQLSHLNDSGQPEQPSTDLHLG